MSSSGRRDELWASGQGMARNLIITTRPKDEIPPLPTKEQLKRKWDDKDIDDSNIKESWEDENELAPPLRLRGLKAMGSMESDSD
ncbi:hypothetical protein CXB51_013856 [Gossypium anomalum]|uniref:Uncharacterized protein n=1 Tax=Gossypium anomalum TaxID=47600 RepID=A0A8J5YJC2_9ROSI|nr:hypothetical protein CXB51_013856 [Gossypium anomalum]